MLQYQTLITLMSIKVLLALIIFLLPYRSSVQRIAKLLVRVGAKSEAKSMAKEHNLMEILSSLKSLSTYELLLVYSLLLQLRILL